MIWTVCLLLSVALLIGAIAYLLITKEHSLYIFAAGIVLSDATMFFPVYMEYFSGYPWKTLRSVLLSLHNTIRLFIVDGEFDFILDNTVDISSECLYNAYTVLAAILYLVTPLITFGIVLSILKYISVHFRYWISHKNEIFVFSDLNSRSLTLAKSILNTYKIDTAENAEGYTHKGKRSLIVFTDVYEANEENLNDRITEAHGIKALCFREDITAYDFAKHKSGKKISFFIIGNDETENIKQLEQLKDQYINNSKITVSIYLFSSSVESELAVNDLNAGKIRVKRIDEARNTVYNELYKNGIEIFDTAAVNEDGSKQINAIIAGLGSYGKEMLKALPWFCQMDGPNGQKDGYRINIDAFDIRDNARSRFNAECPELMDPGHNNKDFKDGDACYYIQIHDNVDIMSDKFDNYIKSATPPTYVLVSLGSDALNIEAAVRLRALFQREKNAAPIIKAVVYEPAQAAMLKDAKNFKGAYYEIGCIGSLDEAFSYNSIINTDLESEALRRHIGYAVPSEDNLTETDKEQKKKAAEKEFWQCEYNYRSSITSVIHAKMRQLLNLPGADRHVDQRKPDELNALRKLEHRRWNAYMRSEGYSYSPERNDMAKLHDLLRPFNTLGDEEKRRDDVEPITTIVLKNSENNCSYTKGR